MARASRAWVVGAFAAAVIGICGVCNLAAAEQTKQTYCKYRYYQKNAYQCFSEDLEKAKKQCAEQASKKHGEKITCWCTQDPKYVDGVCK